MVNRARPNRVCTICSSLTLEALVLNVQSEIAQNILFLFQSSLTRMALHALSRMETRKFHSTTMECAINPEETSDTNDNASTTCQTEDIAAKCVICLEKFKDGQVNSLAFFLPLFYSFIHSLIHPSIRCHTFCLGYKC